MQVILKSRGFIYNVNDETAEELLNLAAVCERLM
jgi:hypothetical protein